MLAIRGSGDDSMNGDEILSSAAVPLSKFAAEHEKKIQEDRKGIITQYAHEDDKEGSEAGKDEQFILIDPTLPMSLQMPIETDFLNRLCDSHLPLPELIKLLLRFITYYRHRPIPKSLGRVQLFIKRNKSGFIKKLYPEYKLYLGSNDRFIMVGQRMQLMRSAYYLITTEAKVTDRKSPGCLGKLRSNFQETEFDLFGIGENLEKKLPYDQLRAQHASIIYNLGVTEVKAHSKMDVLIPKHTNDKEPYNWKPTAVLLNIT